MSQSRLLANFTSFSSFSATRRRAQGTESREESYSDQGSPLLRTPGMIPQDKYFDQLPAYRSDQYSEQEAETIKTTGSRDNQDIAAYPNRSLSVASHRQQLSRSNGYETVSGHENFSAPTGRILMGQQRPDQRLTRHASADTGSAPMRFGNGPRQLATHSSLRSAHYHAKYQRHEQIDQGQSPSSSDSPVEPGHRLPSTHQESDSRLSPQMSHSIVHVSLLRRPIRVVPIHQPPDRAALFGYNGDGEELETLPSFPVIRPTTAPGKPQRAQTAQIRALEQMTTHQPLLPRPRTKNGRPGTANNTEGTSYPLLKTTGLNPKQFKDVGSVVNNDTTSSKFCLSPSTPLTSLTLDVSQQLSRASLLTQLKPESLEREHSQRLGLTPAKEEHITPSSQGNSSINFLAVSPGTPSTPGTPGTPWGPEGSTREKDFNIYDLEFEKLIHSSRIQNQDHLAAKLESTIKTGSLVGSMSHANLRQLCDSALKSVSSNSDPSKSSRPASQNKKNFHLSRIAYDCIATSVTVMGSSLADITPAICPTLFEGVNHFLPVLIVKIIGELDQRGLDVLDLISNPANPASVTRLINIFNAPPTYGRLQDLTSENVHSLCQILNQYLSSLPDPVMNNCLWNIIWIFCVKPGHLTLRPGDDKESIQKDKVRIAQIVILLMPARHFDLLVYLVGFLRRLHVSIATSISAKQISKMFGPSLFCPRPEQSSGSGLASATKTVAVSSDAASRTLFWLIRSWPAIASGLQDDKISHAMSVPNKPPNLPVDISGNTPLPSHLSEGSARVDVELPCELLESTHDLTATCAQPTERDSTQEELITTSSETTLLSPLFTPSTPQRLGLSSAASSYNSSERSSLNLKAPSATPDSSIHSEANSTHPIFMVLENLTNTESAYTAELLEMVDSDEKKSASPSSKSHLKSQYTDQVIRKPLPDANSEKASGKIHSTKTFKSRLHVQKIPAHSNRSNKVEAGEQEKSPSPSVTSFSDSGQTLDAVAKSVYMSQKTFEALEKSRNLQLRNARRLKGRHQTLRDVQVQIQDSLQKIERSQHELSSVKRTLEEINKQISIGFNIQAGSSS